MPIQANVTNNQITAQVGETQIDVNVSGGFGPSGAAGAAGQAATITVGTVTTGAPGSSASVVNGGSSSAAVLNFTIPAGATGPQGERGLQGERGEQGIQGIQGIQGPAGATGATGPAGTTSWNGITDRPSTFAPTAHTHDDRYYTESEVDTLLAGKQASGSYVLTTDARLSDARQPLTHTHTASQISDFTSAVIAAAPPTTNASLLTSGTLPDARLSANIARTSDVTAAVANVVNAAPASLDTLAELASALNNDASFSATVTNALAAKAPLASPTFTGTVSGVTAAMVGLSNVDNTSDASKPVSSATQTALDAKAALVHTHTVSAITDAGTAATRNVPATGNASSTQVVLGSDTRLTDARTPVEHKQSHFPGASDAITPSDIGAAAANHFHYAVDIADFSSAASQSSPVQSVAGRTGAVTIAAADVSGLGSLATQSSVSYASLTGVPSTFAPSAHKASHATGGSDALSPADIGAASASHAHAAIDVTSGVFDIARLPVGTGSSQVAAGNDSRFTDSRTPTDGSVTDAKIATAGLSASSINWVAIQPWAANTAYAKGDLVSNAGVAYRRSAAGTSGATFNAANWQQITPSEFVASQVASGTLDVARIPSLPASQITSGTIAAARLGSGTADATTFLRGDGTFATPSASVTYATTAQAQDLTATSVAMNPANVRNTLFGWKTASYSNTFTQNGASIQSAYSSGNILTILTGATANGRASIYHQADFGYAGNRYSKTADWTKPITIRTRIYRQVMSTNAVFRFLFGQFASSGFAYETLSGRGIGFEQRQSRLWLICHDGTTLTQFDTGINGATSDYSGNPADIILRSDGAGTLAISVVVAGGAASTASTSGAPTSVNTNVTSQPYAALTNGGDTTSCQMFFFPHQFTDA